MTLQPNPTFTPSEQLQCARAILEATKVRKRPLPELTSPQARCYGPIHRSECPVCRPELDG